MKYTAIFQTVDKQSRWDCTEFLKQNPLVLFGVMTTLEKEEFYQDESGILKQDPTAPKWVRESIQSFSLTVKDDFVERQIAKIQTRVDQLKALTRDMDDSPSSRLSRYLVETIEMFVQDWQPKKN